MDLFVKGLVLIMMLAIFSLGALIMFCFVRELIRMKDFTIDDAFILLLSLTALAIPVWAIIAFTIHVR